MAALTPFKVELAKIARRENESFGSLRRGDRELENRIERYCSDVGVSATTLVRSHYSAVFISWCMRTAGASEAQFPAQISHSEYAKRAFSGAENREGLFQARRVESYAPQPGDVIHLNRDGGKVDYDRIRAGGYNSESGIVVDIQPNKAVIVMGNQEPRGNVGIEALTLADSGLLIQRIHNPFICVIEVLK